MRVVLVGNGGREHALAWRLAASPSRTSLVVTGPNPGWPAGVAVDAASDVAGWVAVARRHRAELVVVGPEVPLSLGLADALADAGIPCFGPTKAAAALETSKAFTKEVLQAAGVPTAGARVVDLRTADGRAAALDRCRLGAVVLKADGLAAGKGVVVCPTAAEALAALDGMLRFGDAAARVLLEDLLFGPEVSLFALCDGERAVALPSAQDHKTLLDGGQGPNTGGMGAICPCPLVPPALGAEWVQRIHAPVLAEMARRGTPFRGVLYAGLMLTADGPKVLEFNVRFGDPECQVLMAMWADDPLPWLLGAATGRLPAGAPTARDGAACCVVLAAAGYPETPRKGDAIPEGPPPVDGVVFQAGTVRGPDGALRTNGGRVLGVTAHGATLAEARARAYAAVPGWTFAGAQLRSDIGGAFA